MRPTLTSHGNVLITGATGLIGGEILRLLTAQPRPGRVWALVRPLDARGPAERLQDRLARSGDEPPRAGSVIPVAGDVLRPAWGLADRDRQEIAADVNVIIHNAADTSFAARRDTARTNVGSVHQLIEFARSCRRPPLIAYMSTASNAGRVSGGCLTEDDGCRPENDHFNEYTQSKAVAEQLLRESGLPVLVLRPTIVLSAGLPDPGFGQILWCAPLGRVFRALPIDPAGRVDLVDVGFVAGATLQLLARPGRRYDCYHLSAGAGGGTTIGELSHLVDRVYGRKKGLQLIPPAQWTRDDHRVNVRSPLQRRVFRSLRHYFPFLNMDVVYDVARLRADLGAAAPSISPAESYLPDLLRLIRPKAALKEAALP